MGKSLPGRLDAETWCPCFRCTFNNLFKKSKHSTVPTRLDRDTGPLPYGTQDMEAFWDHFIFVLLLEFQMLTPVETCTCEMCVAGPHKNKPHPLKRLDSSSRPACTRNSAELTNPNINPSCTSSKGAIKLAEIGTCATTKTP